MRSACNCRGSRFAFLSAAMQWLAKPLKQSNLALLWGASSQSGSLRTKLHASCVYSSKAPHCSACDSCWLLSRHFLCTPTGSNIRAPVQFSYQTYNCTTSLKSYSQTCFTTSTFSVKEPSKVTKISVPHKICNAVMKCQTRKWPKLQNPFFVIQQIVNVFDSFCHHYSFHTKYEYMRGATITRVELWSI